MEVQDVFQVKPNATLAFSRGTTRLLSPLYGGFSKKSTHLHAFKVMAAHVIVQCTTTIDINEVLLFVHLINQFMHFS